MTHAGTIPPSRSHHRSNPCSPGRDAAGKIRAHFLRPAELLCCREPCVITTVLGSCVSITMFHRKLGLAAMCHAMLAQPREGHRPCSRTEELKYVTAAVRAMDSFFRRMDIPPREIEVKLFGGANMLRSQVTRTTEVGAANIAMSRELLAAAGYEFRVSDVGGDQGRKIIFDTTTGGICLKRLTRPAPKNNRNRRHRPSA